MTAINCLPYNVIDVPDIGSLDIQPDVYPKFMVMITDAWGKRWYLRTIGRDHYEWTRSQCFARRLSMNTAKKHAGIIADVWRALIEATEDA